MNRYTYTIIGILLLAVQSTFAQVADPVKWSFSVEKQGSDSYNLILKATIEEHWHLYSQFVPADGPNPTLFTFNKNANFKLVGTVNEISKAEEKYDEGFGMKLKLFSNKAVFVQKIKPLVSQPFTITGELEFQCCDDSKCLPPKTVEFSFEVPATKLTVATESASTIKTGENSIDVSKEDSIAADSVKADTTLATNLDTTSTTNANATSSTSDNTEDSSLWGFFLLAFAAGIAGIFTPCVYPMIPMTVSFFMRGEANRSKGIVKGLVFGLSIIFIYTMIGVVVMLTQSGADLTSVISTHWLPNLIFFVLFLVFAASFFGLFEIMLPGSLANKVDQQAEKGGFIGAFFMALTLVIVSFSCTGPIVGAILVEASKGFALKPVLGMFGFSLAFAIPFVIFAFSPSLMKKLAKSGSWLNSVKIVFAFVLLAFSLKFLLAVDTTYHWGILTREVYLSVWIVLFTLLGLYLLGKIKFSHDSESNHVSVPKLLLAIASFSFAVYLVPGMFGAPLNSISSMLPPPSKNNVFSMSGGEQKNKFNQELCGTPRYSELLELPYGLQGYFELNEGLACAAKQNKPVFLDVKGHACANCKKMEAEVWSDPRVQEKLAKNFVIIALYTDDKTALPEAEWITSSYDGKVKKTMGAKNLDYEITKFNTNTQPLYAVMGASGNLVGKPMGMNLNVEEFLKFLDEGIEAAKAK